jgi:tyrosinase
MSIEIKIGGVDRTGASYITWAPVHSSISLVGASGSAGPVDVVLRNQNSAEGGQVVFREVMTGEEQDTLQLSLPADGTTVDFFVAGKFGRPSLEDEDAVIEVVEANSDDVISTKSLMVRIRKNANTLTEGERDRFLEAFAELNGQGMGRFGDFRDMHTRAAIFEGHGLAGFLPWHRAYLLDLERELQMIDPSVALPYWRFDEPAPRLFDREFIGVSNDGRVEFVPGHPLELWRTDLEDGIRRNPRFEPEESPADPVATPIPLNSQNDTLLLGGVGNLYATFRQDMEVNPHNRAHGNFRGFLSDPHTAAKDPLFFLLHANVDRLWALWQSGGPQQQLPLRFDPKDRATYPFLGKDGDPDSAPRVGHNAMDSMWPWNGVTGTGSPDDRPVTAPGGTLAASPTANAPGPMPEVGDMIDYQGRIDSGNRLGFDYDDVPFGFQS